MSTQTPKQLADPGAFATELRSLMAEEFRTLETETLLDRYRLMRGVGATFNGRRDLYHVLGYERVLTVAHYRERYERGGVAGSVVDIMPHATWRGEFQLVEDEQKLKKSTYTPFEQEWKKFSDRLEVPTYLRKVDILSRLSTYAVLLIGAADGDLRTELPKGNGTTDALVHLQPYCGAGGWRMSGTRPSLNSQMMVAQSNFGADATIKEWELDITSKQYGRPKVYGLRRTDFSAPQQLADVHWSRVIHVAEDTLDDDVFGRPALARSWNLFDDLEKVSGGGSEAFWLRANKGLQLDIDKEVKTVSDDDKKELKKQVEDYVHEMSRVLRTRGVKVTELGSDVANFANPGDFLMTQIAGANRVPKRLLTGSEQGELASSQDRENFRDQVHGRQTGYAGPSIVRRLAQRLLDYNYLPQPKQYVVKWPDTEVLTEDERAAGALKWAQINQACAAAGLPPAFTDEELRDHWYGFEPIPVETLKKLTDAMAAKTAASKPTLPAEANA